MTTPQFIALAEAESGQDLDHFFQVWLYTPEKPDQLVVSPAARSRP